MVEISESDMEHYNMCWELCKWFIKRYPKALEEYFIEETQNKD